MCAVDANSGNGLGEGAVGYWTGCTHDRTARVEGGKSPAGIEPGRKAEAGG